MVYILFTLLLDNCYSDSHPYTDIDRCSRKIFYFIRCIKMLGAFNIFGPSTQSKPASGSPDTPVTNERVVDLKTLIFFGKDTE